MLPFLDKKKAAQSIIDKRRVDGSVKPSMDSDPTDEALELAQALVSAIDAKDLRAIALIIEDIVSASQPLQES